MKNFLVILILALGFAAGAQTAAFKRSGTNLPFATSIASNYVFNIDRGGGLPPANVTYQSLRKAMFDYVNAYDYGADGTDTKDDTAALQAALTAAGAGTKKTVFIPGGTYYIGAALVVPYGVNILGAGSERQDTATPGGTFITQTNDANVLSFPVICQQWVADIGLRGWSNSVHAGLAISNGLASANGEQFTARNVSVKNMGRAVVTHSPSVTRFESCYFFGNLLGVGLHDGYADTIAYVSCNLGYGTNGSHNPNTHGGSVPIFTTTGANLLKNFLVLNCEIGNANPVLDSAGGVSAVFQNCNFERLGWQSTTTTNVFVLRNSLDLKIDGCRIVQNTLTNAAVGGSGAGVRRVSMRATFLDLANHTAPVEGSISGPLVFDDTLDTSQFYGDSPTGVWRVLVSGQYVYRSTQTEMATARTAAAPTPTIKNRGQLWNIISDDSDHATEIDRLAYIGYRTNASPSLNYLATLADIPAGVTNTTVQSSTNAVFYSGSTTVPAVTLTNTSYDTALKIFSGDKNDSGHNAAELFSINTAQGNPVSLKIGILGNGTAGLRGQWLQVSETGVSDDRIFSLQQYGGKVVIGKTAASATLDVNGTMTGGSLYVTNFLGVVTNYAGNLWVPVQGQIRFFGSNNAIYSVSTTKTNLIVAP